MVASACVLQNATGEKCPPRMPSSKLVGIIPLKFGRGLEDFKIVGGPLPSSYLYSSCRPPSSESFLLVVGSDIASISEALRVKIASGVTGAQIAGILLKGNDVNSDTVREVEKLVGVKVLGVIQKGI